MPDLSSCHCIDMIDLASLPSFPTCNWGIKALFSQWGSGVTHPIKVHRKKRWGFDSYTNGFTWQWRFVWLSPALDRWMPTPWKWSFRVRWMSQRKRSQEGVSIVTGKPRFALFCFCQGIQNLWFVLLLCPWSIFVMRYKLSLLLMIALLHTWPCPGSKTIHFSSLAGCFFFAKESPSTFYYWSRSIRLISGST